ELIGRRRPGRVLVIDLEERPLPVADLEEAHDLPEIVAVTMIDLAALDRGDDPFGDDGSLEMGRRARFGQWQVGRVAQGEDVRAAADLEGGPVRRQPTARRRGEPGVDEEL